LAVRDQLRPDPDQTQVAATLRGNLRAFETLVERHREVVVRVAARIVGEDDAEDVAQDAFLRAFHRLESFRGDAPFRTWLLQITHNLALNAAARRREEPVQESADAVAAQGTPVDRLESRERQRRLDVKLKALSPAHRAVLVLRDVEGFSYDEISRVTDTPLGSVKARLHRARGELISALRANTYDWDLPR
jgi:RNA polymerase sigma-70 factor (ECF subfamily)